MLLHDLNCNCGSPFVADDKMRRLLRHNPYLLPVLSRFGIALGFGESTVREVCARDEVDLHTFLIVCNFFSGHETDVSKLDLSSLIGYLKSSHTYFLDYILPTIRNKLIGAISTGNGADFAWMLIKFYDEYVNEVRRHMEYEDNKVFEYVMNLLNGVKSRNFSITTFEKNHHPISEKLRDIKELFIGHYTAELGRVDMLNSVLFDIILCERDLMLHCKLEDEVFVPAVRKIEESVELEGPKSDDDVPEAVGKSQCVDEHGDIVLTARECDIVRSIARGLSNKEIADKLFLSVHTVTTHRRNISAKLNIHSPSGITIYAIMHGLITLEEGASLIR